MLLKKNHTFRIVDLAIDGTTILCVVLVPVIKVMLHQENPNRMVPDELLQISLIMIMWRASGLDCGGHIAGNSR